MNSARAFLGVILCVAGVARAGVVVHQVEKVKTRGSNSEGQSILYVQNGLVRTERRDSNGRLEHFSLFRDGAILQFNPAAHTVKRFDRAAMEKMMAQVPPQARAMMEKLRASGSAHHESPWRDTGRTDRVGAFSCRIWEGSPAGETEDACVAAFNALPGGDELEAALRQMSATASEITAALPYASEAVDAFARYSRFNGIPVSTHTATVETRVVGVEKKAISTDLFQVPAGYQQQPITSR